MSVRTSETLTVGAISKMRKAKALAKALAKANAKPLARILARALGVAGQDPDEGP